LQSKNQVFQIKISFSDYITNGIICQIILSIGFVQVFAGEISKSFRDFSREV